MTQIMEIVPVKKCSDSTLWLSCALFGRSKKYLDGVRENLRYVRQAQADVKMLLHHDDTVPSKFLENLRRNWSEECELVDMTAAGFPRTQARAAWRFWPFEDPLRNRVVSLDIDARECGTFLKRYQWTMQGATDRPRWLLSTAFWHCPNTEAAAEDWGILDANGVGKMNCIVRGLRQALLDNIAQEPVVKTPHRGQGFGQDEYFLNTRMVPALYSGPDMDLAVLNWFARPPHNLVYLSPGLGQPPTTNQRAYNQCESQCWQSYEQTTPHPYAMEQLAALVHHHLHRK